MMDSRKATLEKQRAELERVQAILRQSKDDVTGQALSSWLGIHLERAIARLLTVTADGDFRAIQAEAMAYQRLLDVQTRPPFNPSNNQ